MKKNINRYLHLTLDEFIDIMNNEEMCPEEFKLENGDCFKCGTDINECTKCWKNAVKDIPFKNELMTFEKENLMVLTHLAQIEKQFKEMDSQRKELKSTILKSMEEYDVQSFDNDIFSISCRKPSTVRTFDTNAFKKDYPDLYEKYLKESTRPSSVIFKLR